MFKATGKNTYSVKEDLKAVGFVWNSEKKEWTAETFDQKAWEEKYKNPTYNGRKYARICSEIKIEEITGE